ncbi:MAG TPA: hypothetical protein VFE62_28100 [Gemmataceae bacterium]|nr:hypothetical protein [Gemmataceae bacterium]
MAAVPLLQRTGDARIKDSLETRRKAGLTEKEVEFREGDALKVKDLEKATVIILCTPEFMQRLEPQIKTRLKPGTRIVAHDYPFEMLDVDRMVQLDAGDGRTKTLYLWTIREPKK